MSKKSKEIITVTILSDSYLSNHRITKPLRKGFNIKPHVSHIDADTIYLTNLSKGAYTIQKLRIDNLTIQQWIGSEPRITLIHLGAVELVNRSLVLDINKDSVGINFYKYLTECVEFLNSKAEEYLGHSYHEWASNHRYIVAQLPDWKLFTSNRENSLSPEQYRNIRQKVNKYLKRSAGKLLDKFDVVLISPNTNKDKIHGVHYSPLSQARYVREIVNAVRKVACKFCYPVKGMSDRKIQNLQLCCNNICTESQRKA